MGLAFDQVAVRMAAGVNLLSAEEWLQMPITEQYELITSSKVEFLCEGERVRATDAVKSINASRTA